MKNYKQVLFITFFFAFSVPLMGGIYNYSDNVTVLDVKVDNELKSSNFWFLNSSIFIDNWSYTKDTFDWCSGSGIFTDPYIIENITVRAPEFESCIEIRDTTDYFKIKNCTLYDAWGASFGAGISLNNVHNGAIVDCKITDNDRQAIFLESCTNNIISDNFLNDNGRMGVALRLSHDNTIFNNTLLNNGYFGVYLTGSYNNTVSYNEIKENGYGGISFYSNCYDNIIKNNLFLDNNKRISHRDPWSANIQLRDNCDSNTFLNNTVKNHFFGIELESDCHSNLIYKNIFENVVENAYDDSNNNNWNKGMFGNYWHDYAGTDSNDDGIGDIPYNINNSVGVINSQDNFPIWHTKPNISIISPLNNSYWNEEPLIHVIATDHNLNYTWYNISNHQEFLESNVSEYVEAYIWDLFPEGSFLIEFFANDTININDDIEYNVIKDTLQPFLEVLSPIHNTFFCNEQPKLVVNISDVNLNSYWYTLNEESEKYYFFNDNLMNKSIWDNLPYGNVTITFGVDDKAGNRVYKEILVKKCREDDGSNSIGGYHIIILLVGYFSISIIYLGVRRRKLKSEIGL